MTNVTKETIALAKQLWALHQEALGGYDVSLWDEELTTIEREAWVQVAQHVDARDSTSEYIDIYARNGGIEYKKIKMLIDEPDHK